MASIRRRKDRQKNPWIVDCRDVPGGRRLAVATKEEAELLRAKMVSESQQAQPPVQDRDITLDAYADRWLEQVSSSLDPRSIDAYRANLRLYIRPIFGSTKLRSIHRGHIKALLAKKRNDGLSKNSVRMIRATLSVLLGDAVEDVILQVNPALGVGRRGRKPDAVTPADRQKQIRVMTHEQLATFLATANAKCSRRNAVLFLLLADTGVRPGEGCALKWSDVDPVRRTLQIERAVDNTGTVKHTKTHESRVVDLSPRLAATLSDFQAALEAEALLAGKDGLIPWIFPTSTERPVTPKRTARVFRGVLRAAGLPAFNLYSLRHSYASHLLAESAPLPYVSAMLGHRKPTTTLLYYAHAMPKVDRRFIEHLEQVRAAAKPLPVPTAAQDDAGLELDDERMNDHSRHHFGTTRQNQAKERSQLDGKIEGETTETLAPALYSRS